MLVSLGTMLNLVQLNPLPNELDLCILSADQSQRPYGVQDSEISSLVKSVSSQERKVLAPDWITNEGYS